MSRADADTRLELIDAIISAGAPDREPAVWAISRIPHTTRHYWTTGESAPSWSTIAIVAAVVAAVGAPDRPKGIAALRVIARKLTRVADAWEACK